MRTALEKYTLELHAQNGLHAALYRTAISNLCDELHSMDLWSHSIVSTYWVASQDRKLSWTACF